MLRHALAAVVLSSLTWVAADAATLTVRQDGTGDYATLGAALGAAAGGDVILVGPGTYSEYLTVSVSVAFEAEGGAAVTFLDGLNTQRLFVVQGSCTVSFRGFTFTRAGADEGAALLVWQQAHVVVDDCVFADNRAQGSNAVHARHPNTSLRLRKCDFVGNRAEVHSGALSASMGASLYVEDCLFLENKSDTGHGAMNAQSAYVEIQRCLFLRNTGGSVGALTLEYCSGIVSENTFHANSGSGGTVRLSDYTFFTRNIISGELRGYGLQTVAYTSHTCNLYYGNHAGAVSQPLGAGELVADPLYCDVATDNLELCSGSPALAEDGGCGVRGAFGEGCTCGPIGTEGSSWGRLKCSFR